MEKTKANLLAAEIERRFEVTFPTVYISKADFNNKFRPNTAVASGDDEFMNNLKEYIDMDINFEG